MTTTTTTSPTRLKPRARRRRAAAGGRTRSTLAEHGLAEAPDRRQHAEREDQHQHRKADDEDRLDLRGEILEVVFHVPLLHPSALEHELVQGAGLLADVDHLQPHRRERPRRAAARYASTSARASGAPPRTKSAKRRANRASGALTRILPAIGKRSFVRSHT